MSVPEIIAHVQVRYVEPARRRGEKRVVIRAGDVHDEMRLKDRQPLVCYTLTSEKLLRQCNMSLINEKRGSNVHQKHARNIWYTYLLTSTELHQTGFARGRISI